MQVSKRIFNLETETAFSILSKANKLQSDGKDIINLGIDQPDFLTPKNMVETAIKALYSFEWNEVNQNSESFLSIDTYNYKIFIYPSLDKAFLLYRKNNWKILKINYESLLQSNLTNIFVKDIILHGKCGLTTINESFLIHKKMLDEFIKFTNKIRNKKFNSCMIT